MYIKRATNSNFAQIITIWENAVRATHDFLPEKMITILRPLILHNYLPNIDVYISIDEQNNITGFMGIKENRLEMLFISAILRGQSIGKALLQYGVNQLAVNEVDVNERNKQAMDFYQRQGFRVYDRSELDGQGNPFPLLHMRLVDINIANPDNTHTVSAAN